MFDLVKIAKNYCVLESNITIYDKPPSSAVLNVTHLRVFYCGFCSRVFVHKLTPSLIHHGPQKKIRIEVSFRGNSRQMISWNQMKHGPNIHAYHRPTQRPTHFL